MTFDELNTVTQDKIVDMLNNHVASTANILKENRCLIPMLVIPDSNQIICLQSSDGSVDVDRAYDISIAKLRNEDFTYALFSYSTRICFDACGQTDALKTSIINKNGLEVSFYTPFKIHGLFKKSINIEKSILFEIKENVFA